MRRLVRLSLVASLLYGMGAHWSALQGAAWAGMIAARVSESSLADAVRTTLSGEKPCHVCRIVERASTLERGPSLTPPRPPLHVVAVAAPALTPVAGPASVPPSGVLRARSRAERPDAPPPKKFLLA
jgi:hypothetical protein